MMTRKSSTASLPKRLAVTHRSSERTNVTTRQLPLTRLLPKNALGPTSDSVRNNLYQRLQKVDQSNRYILATGRKEISFRQNGEINNELQVLIGVPLSTLHAGLIFFRWEYFLIIRFNLRTVTRLSSDS